MHLIIHIIFNILVGFIFKLNITEILLLGFGGAIIDLDHILYMVVGQKLYNPKRMWEFHKKERRINNPHYYVFHYIELIILAMIISYFINWYAFLIFAGFLLHWFLDAVMYLNYYKSLNPWIKYYSLAAYFIESHHN
jgi:hypothetical protein